MLALLMFESRRALLLALASSLILASGCPKEDDPEAQIRAAIERTAQAAEAKDTGGVMDIISEKSFKSSGFDAKEIRGIVFAQLRQASWQKVFLLRTSVALQDDTHAKAETTAVLARGSASSVQEAVGADSGTYRFELELEKEGDDWKVVAVEYQRANLKNLLGVE